MPSSWPKVVYIPPICITIRLPFVSRYFCRSIRFRGRRNTPNYCKLKGGKPPPPPRQAPARALWQRGAATLLRHLPSIDSSEKLEKAVTVDFEKHPARRLGQRPGQCRPKVRGQFAFSCAQNRILKFKTFGQKLKGSFYRG